MKVVVLGYTDDPSKYSNIAFLLLLSKKFEVVGVNPRTKGPLICSTLEEAEVMLQRVDVITVYVNSGISTKLKEDIISLEPRKVIFNPGAENDTLALELQDKGIKTENACSLVLLKTGQFNAD